MLCERLTFMCTTTTRCDIVYVLLPSYSSQIMEMIITHNNTVEFVMARRVYRNGGPMEKMLQKQRLLLDLRFSEQSRKHFYAIVWHDTTYSLCRTAYLYSFRIDEIKSSDSVGPC